MDPLIDRISHLEKNLDRLFKEAGDISIGLKDLKSEVHRPKEHAIKTPPPLPKVTIPEPDPAPLVVEKKAPPKKVPVVKPSVKKPEYNGGLELQLGRVWFVRIGIILLTTGLVFLSSYTYHNYVHDLSAGTRLGLFYLLAGIITGVGLYCEKWKDNLKSYGRIVAAGGLSTVYYCSFAAYHVDALKVINSPVIASLLLLLSAGLFCGVSLWKQSRLMLSTSLSLAFYSISINPNGLMVCVSSFILAAFGIAMMNRTKWMATGFVVLVGSYLSFGWWQLTIAQSSSDTQIFLICYWLLFVAASLLPKQVGDDKSQGVFSSINHSAFFLLFSLDLKTFTWIDHHWVFCLVLGTALLAIGLLGRKRLPGNSIILHLTKGVGLITLGISLKLTGHVLFLTLFIESLLLLAVCFRYPHPIARLASQIVAGLGLIVALFHYGTSGEVPTLAWTIAAILCLAYSVVDRLSRQGTESTEANPVSIVASTLAFGFIVFGSTLDWPTEFRCFLLAVPGIFVPFAIRNEKIRPIIFDTLMVSMMVAPISLTYLFGQHDPASSTFFIGAVIALLISAAHTYRRETFAWLPDHLIEGIHLTLGILLLVTGIFLEDFANETRFILLTLIPIAGTLISLKTKLRIHATIPALFYITLLFVGNVDAPFLLLGSLLSLGHLLILKNHHTLEDRDQLQAASYLFATGMFLLWIIAAFSQPLPIITWSAIGLLLSARYLPRTLTYVPAGTYFIVAAFYLLVQTSSFAASLALLAPASLHLWNTHKKITPRFNLLAVGSFLGLWIQITRDCPLSSLSAVWAITGTLLLLTGLFFRSRAFRLSALVILLASLGHVMLIDIINLDPLPRILSFITLGLGLLGLGFVYNRWQERLKQIL